MRDAALLRGVDMRRSTRKGFESAPRHVQDFLFDLSDLVHASLRERDYKFFRGKPCRRVSVSRGDLDADLSLDVAHSEPPRFGDEYCLAFTPHLDAEEKFRVSLIHPRGRRQHTIMIPFDVRLAWKAHEQSDKAHFSMLHDKDVIAACPPIVDRNFPSPRLQPWGPRNLC